MSRKKKQEQQSAAPEVVETASATVQVAGGNVQDRLIAAMKNRACALLERNAEQIMQSYNEAVELHNENDSDKKFKYKIPISLSLTGVDPDTYEVEAKIAYAVKHVDVSTVPVSTRTAENDMVELANAGGLGESEAEEE